MVKAFVDAIVREIADAVERNKKKSDKIKRSVEERRESIRKGARRAPKKFHL